MRSPTQPSESDGRKATRAAGVKLAADRIGALFDATAREGGVKPGRKGLRAMLRALTGASG